MVPSQEFEFISCRGQDPFEALWITFCATIAGLVGVHTMLSDAQTLKLEATADFRASS